MKRPLVFVLLAMVAIPTALFGQDASPGAAMKRDIAYLASDLLDGRATGSAGNDSAALYIARTYQRLGLAGAFHVARCDQNPGCPGVYFERF